jgi:hypothetical protein
MLQFSQAPAGVWSDFNEFGVVVFGHRLISFVNRDGENDIYINNEVNQ